ncbi:MAG: hypothetical protein LBC44_02005 [Mycoplasmataceae bacterium]|jgi:hypothetical protein|nr:hypothetical protein [Mycoplasmataceae bacterium]
MLNNEVSLNLDVEKTKEILNKISNLYNLCMKKQVERAGELINQKRKQEALLKKSIYRYSTVGSRLGFLSRKVRYI